MDYSFKILDCKKYRDEKERQIKDKILLHSLKLKLVIIQVGDDERSNSYIKNKLKACERCNISVQLIKLDVSISEINLISIINNLNNDSSVTGILVQSPLPIHINKDNIDDSIVFNKDVDGFSLINKGRLYSNKHSLVPCTAKGIIDFLKYCEVDLEGKKVVIINRSYLLGKPLMHLFIQNNSTVTVCHSYTQNLKDITSTADILIVGVGIPMFIKRDYIKRDAIILDVGINLVDGKLFGDVDFNDCIEICSKITKVPGGVGLLTVTNLMMNILDAHTYIS